MNGRERKDELVKRAQLLEELAIAATHPALPAAIDNNQLVRELTTLVRDIADLIANPPCCDGGPQWGHAWTCPTLPG